MFRGFVDTPGSVKITADEIVVRLSKRAHNPLLQEACLIQRTKAVPWLADRVCASGVSMTIATPRPPAATAGVPRSLTLPGKLGGRSGKVRGTAKIGV